MLQINVQPYASDALEDAMRLAQTKALNSYSWSDMLNYLNYTWMDIYQRINQMDEGYYSITVQLTKRITKLPPFLKNSIRVYAAQSPIGFNRDIYRASGYNDLQSVNTYHISGFDLYCPDAERRTVWLNYIPMQHQIFFTRNNRDPKLYDEYIKVENYSYNMYRYQIEQDPLKDPSTRNVLHWLGSVPSGTSAKAYDVDITDILNHGDPDANGVTQWTLVYLTCDFPYIFCTWKHNVTGEYHSGFYKDIVHNSEFIEYNPFAFIGRNSNVEYLHCKWNDKTGMGVVIIDHNDSDKIKELGWTPDTLLVYPAPEAYRFFVARLADKLSALNESNVMGVSRELVEAQYAFDNFLKKDKSAWSRIDNVNGPTVGDLL